MNVAISSFDFYNSIACLGKTTNLLLNTRFELTWLERGLILWNLMENFLVLGRVVFVFYAGVGIQIVLLALSFAS